MITVRTKLNEEMQKELTRPALITYFIMMIIGIVGLLAYIIIGVATNANVEFLLAFSIPFGMGLVFYLTIKKQLRQVVNSTKVNVYELNEDYMNIKTINNGEDVGTTKFYYKEIVKRKESKNYFFLYPNNVNAFPIAKSELSEDELKEVRKLLNIQEKKAKNDKK